MKIPIEEGFHTYGRLLCRPHVQIFDCKTKDDIVDMNEIILRPVLFFVCISDYIINEGHWEKVGKVPYVEAEVEIPMRFVQDPYYLTVELVDAYGKREKTSIERCRELERSAIWEKESVEQRLRDHYAGRPNATVESLKVKELSTKWPSVQHPRKP